MALPKITIHIGAHGFGEVLVDGVSIKGIKSIGFEQTAGEPPIVALHVIAEMVDVETEAILAPHVESLLMMQQQQKEQEEIVTHDLGRG